MESIRMCVSNSKRMCLKDSTTVFSLNEVTWLNKSAHRHRAR